MKIFLSISPAGTWGVKNNNTWLRNLYEPLVDLNHKVYLFRNDLVAREIEAKLGSPKFKAAFSQKLLDTFKKQNQRPFDLFFSYFVDNHIDPLCIDEIKKIGIPTCNFSCNNAHQFYLTEKIAPYFDYNLHSEKDAAEKFRAIGANPIWFPMAANPKYYKPYNIPRKFDVSFVGQRYATRPYYIWHLLENDIKISVFGPGWHQDGTQSLLRKWISSMKRNVRIVQRLCALSLKQRTMLSSLIAHQDFMDHLVSKYLDHFHPQVSDEEMIRMYSKSKISLGFLEVFDNHRPDAVRKLHIHLREFEAPMSRAFYFTQYSDELTEFYEPDREVVVYCNEHELLDKVTYYLSHPVNAERIRQAGYKRASNCHTYQKRFQDLFKVLLSKA